MLKMLLVVLGTAAAILAGDFAYRLTLPQTLQSLVPAPSVDMTSSLEGQGQRTRGGMEERIDSTLPPVFSPKIVPRS